MRRGAGLQQRLRELGAGARPGARSCRGRAAARRSRTYLTSASSTGRPASSFTPSTEATACGTSRASASGASSTNQTPSGIFVQHVGRDLQREPRLAEAAHPDERQQRASCRAARATSASSRSRPTNEVTCCGRLFGVASSERSAGKSCRRSGCSDLVDALGARRDRAAAPRRDRAASRPSGSRSPRSPRPRLRQQDLAAVRGAHDARGAIDRAAEVIAVAALGRSRVQAAAHAQRDAVGRRRIGERAAAAATSPRAASSGSSNAACTPSPVILTTRAAMALDGGARERIVARQRGAHRSRLRFPQPRAALDVGEEQGGAGRRAGVHDGPDDCRAVRCKYKRDRRIETMAVSRLASAHPLEWPYGIHAARTFR